MSSPHSGRRLPADRETMEAEFDSRGDALFNYGYGCFVFTHNICGSKPQIPDGLPDPSVPLTLEFFANPRCPPSTSAVASTLDPVAVSKEDRSENCPAAAGEEITLPMLSYQTICLSLFFLLSFVILNALMLCHPGLL